MRITGGSWLGLSIDVPHGLDVRPTPDKVRQAIFNSLGPRVEQARVLELFAGSGALSLESLSRGATSALCIEKSDKHARFIRDNSRRADLAPGVLDARVQDAFTAIAQLAAEPRQFDLILADPPYGEKNVGRRSTSFAQRLLDDPNLPALLAPGGLWMLGHTKRDTLELPPAWEETRQLKHGDTIIRFLRRSSSGD
jgi:16S rRNA (guanine(966)-N(2))-methyltransferase RsmD